MVMTKRGKTIFDIDVKEVKQGGQVDFTSTRRNLRFIADPSQLSEYPSGGRINALLVRVTNVPLNNLQSGIFVPAQAISDAR